MCGVASSTDSVLGQDFWAPTFKGDNDAFIADLARDRFGWIGEGCTGYDTDSDGVKDPCDNCRFVANNNQQDTDGDGLGDRCDNCRNSGRNADQTDTNLAYEKLAWGAAHPYPSTPTGPADDAYLTDYYPGDICDSHPITATARAGNYWKNALSVRVAPCTEVPATTCTATASTCPVAVGNKLTVRGLVAKTGLSLSALTAVRRCACPAYLGADADCNGDPTFGCDRVVGDTVASTWKVMTLENATEGDPALGSSLNVISGKPALVKTTHFDLAKASTIWAQDWGWNYAADPTVALGSVPAPGTTTTIFDGIVWTSVRNYALIGTTLTGTETIPGAEEDQRQRWHVTRMLTQEAGSPVGAIDPRCLPPVPHYLPRWDTDWVFAPAPEPPGQPGCTACGVPWLTPLFTFKPDDTVDMTYSNVPSKDATPQFSSGARVAMRAATNTVVAISDGLGPTASSSDYGSLVGAIITTSNHQLTGKLSIASGQVGLTSLQNTPVGYGPLVAAVSNARQEVAFFGETDANGIVLDRVRVYDFIQGTSTYKSIISAQKLVNPVAATYRAQDDSYYVLDRATNANWQPVMRLLRLPRGLTAELLGEWPRASVFTNFGLRTGWAGQLVASAWGTSGSRIAIVSLEDDGIHFESLATTSDPLAIPAFLGKDGAFRVRSVQGVSQPVEAIALPQDPILNGSFESSDLTGWSSNGTTAVSSVRNHGLSAVRVGSLTPSGTSTLSQTVNIPPSGVTTLAFWYQMSCPDTVTYDQFKVSVIDNTTSTTYVALPDTCTNTQQWVRVTYPLSALAGHNVTVVFSNHDDNYPGDPSYTLIDDITMQLDLATLGGPPNPILNNNFEASQLASWVSTGSTSVSSESSQMDTQAAKVGSSLPTGTSTLAQTFAVPASGADTLSFYYRMTCPDTVTYDQFSVTLHDNVSGQTYTVLGNTCTNNGQWAHVTYSLGSVAGHSVTLTFSNHDDNYPGDASYTLVDNVTLASTDVMNAGIF